MDEFVYVVGLGMVGTHQLTEEVQVALNRADRIFVVHPHDVVVRALEQEYGDVVSLANEYEEGRPRAETYRAMAERVLEAHRNGSEQVALAVYGHPTFGVTPTTYLRNRSDVVVRPGISSLDALLVDLEIDPFRGGLQVYEANALLREELEMSPRVPTFLYQIGSVESELYSTRPSRPERFSTLREYLLGFYPESHNGLLCRTATLSVEHPEIRRVELSELELIADSVTHSETLYLPPVDDEPAQNEEYARRLTSEDHLDSITRER